MPLQQLSLEVGGADPQPFEELLLEAGALAITLQDAADTPVLEPAPGTTPLWPQVRISALFEAAADLQPLTQRLRAHFPGRALQVHTENLAERVWEREWLKDFKPLRFGRRLWVCPAGQRPPKLDEPQSQQAQYCYVDLDPGLAFGTGTHATTALCLEWLDAAELTGKHVIDYGCGSGILAIAALKLGAASALAVDIDPQALLAAADNAQRNGVAERLTVAAAPPVPSVVCDVLLANILAEPLESLAADFAALVVAHGQLVLSGLLAQQAATVAMRYRPWFDIGPVTLREDWTRLDGVKRASERG
jgi:ribosomal protein L11 methyltransferase